MSSNTSNDIMFEYSGNGQIVPKDVTIVHFHCSVTDVERQTFIECTELKEVVLNEGLVTIDYGAFDKCTSLTSITLPSTVTEIGHKAFNECSSLKEVVLNEGLKEIGELAFEKCTSLQSITLPSTVTSICYHAFACCSLLESIKLPSTFTKIGSCAFYRCTSLESITIPSSVNEIGGCAFTHCTNLREVVLNEGLQRIEHGAFSYCKLQEITIPSSVTEIGDASFYSNNHLKEVVCNGELPKMNHDAIDPTFKKCSALERITFPNISSRLEDVIRAGQADAQNKIQQYINRGDFEWERGDTIYIPAEVYTCVSYTRRRPRWDIVKEHFRQIVKWIRYFEMKEATTIFELALWKAKIDQVEDDIYERDRDACRVEVPGPVKDTIMQYLL